MEEVKVNTITLEDGIKYVIIDTLKIDNNKYIFLSNINDENDMCIRKVVVKEDNQEYLVLLDSEEEFNEVMQRYNQKYERRG